MIHFLSCYKIKSMEEIILIQFYKNELSRTKALEVEKWLKANDQNEERYQQLIKIWESAALASIYPKISLTRKSLQKVKGKTSIQLKHWLRYAAIFVFALGASFYLYQQLNSKVEYIDIVLAKEDLNKEFQLSDGTKVYLKAPSHFRYAKKFKGSTRDVSLDGRAFFEVAKNSKKAFIIKAGLADIKVLGTSFLVNSTPDSTQVSVNTGKVLLSRTKDGSISKILIKNQEATLKESGIEQAENFDINKISWKTGIFDFHNLKLSIALELLNDYYKKPIIIKNPQLLNIFITAYFEKEDQQTILETLEYSCNIQIKDKGNYLEVSRENNN